MTRFVEVWSGGWIIPHLSYPRPTPPGKPENSNFKRIVPPFWPDVETILLHPGYIFNSFAQLKLGKLPNPWLKYLISGTTRPQPFSLPNPEIPAYFLCFGVVQFQVSPAVEAN